MRRGLSNTAVAVVLLCGVCMADAKEAVKSVTWSAHSHSRGCHMNMGPTGAKAWMRGYQLQVMTVDAGSPADGVLERGDLVLGSDGTEFGENADPRMTLGNAIGAAEANDGVLKLKILRDGKKKTVKISLPVTGPFSDTWPFNCQKSKRILYEACDYVSKAVMPDGEVVTDGSAGLFPAGLLLLASGDVRYMDAARRAAYASSRKDFDAIDYSHWAKGYGLVFLTEYYLATGDKTVLDKIKEVADQVGTGQMLCGSWGHNTPGGGYGAMNQAGVICAIGMVLAQECGVDVDRVALNKALDFFGRYAELGAVPYGDHLPGYRGPDDNGKSASSAVLFSLLADRKSETKAFSESIAMSYATRETGHTGGYFSMVWGPMGCAPTGPEALHKFMDYQAWYYNLSRTWKGALVLLPYKEALTRFDGSSYNDAGGEFTAGGMGLAFALLVKRLRIQGAPRSVFGAELKGKVSKARELYQARDWAAFDKAIAACGGKKASAAEKMYAAQLKEASAMMRATKVRTIKEIRNNLEEGDAYRASEQYAALKLLFGDDDEELLALTDQFENGTTQWYIREGKQYYEAWGQVKTAALKSWVPFYGPQAKLFDVDVRDHAPKLWEDVAPTAETVTNSWQVLRLESDADLPRGWAGADFDDSEWTDSKGLLGSGAAGTVVVGRRVFDVDQAAFRGLRLKLRMDRNAVADVFLNGTQVLHVTRGRRSGYAKIELDASSLDLVKKGKNLLAIICSKPGSGGNALDVGLQAVVAEYPWEGPLMTGSVAKAPMQATSVKGPLSSLPEKERNSRSDQLRVSGELDRYKADLNVQYDEMSIEELGDEIGSHVAYRRHLAEGSLVRKGKAGFAVAVKELKSKNWRARSSACNVIGGVWARHKDKEDELGVEIKKEISSLTKLLGDEHFWVRVNAAKSLAAFGTEAKSAAPELAKAATDEEEWVRTAAISAMSRVSDDPAAMLSAARAAMMEPATSFSIVRRSFGVIEKHGAEDPENLSALIYVCEHPAEGMGAHVLASVIERVVSIDEDKALPMLIKVAAGGYAYDRLRGNPRGKAMELLGELGAKAKPAIPALKKVIASDGKKDVSLHDAAKAAIEKIEK